jgi:hypothetical protein
MGAKLRVFEITTFMPEFIQWHIIGRTAWMIEGAFDTTKNQVFNYRDWPLQKAFV